MHCFTFRRFRNYGTCLLELGRTPYAGEVLELIVTSLCTSTRSQCTRQFNVFSKYRFVKIIILMRFFVGHAKCLKIYLASDVTFLFLFLFKQVINNMFFSIKIYIFLHLCKNICFRHSI